MKTNLIIADFSNIGKTYLGNKYQNVIDLDAATYAYTDIELESLNIEEQKGLKRSPNKDFPNNYKKLLKKQKKQYDITLVWDRMDIVNEYLKNNINFIICYPEEICLEEYKNRFLKKGNSKDYIKMKINEYYEKVKYFNTLPIKKIILKEKETLEDYLIKNNINLKEKDLQI